MVKFLQQLADQREIKWQPEILPRGGTDSAAIQKSGPGVPVATISVPTRYIHTTIETSHRQDLQGAVDLLAALLEEGDSANLNLV